MAKPSLVKGVSELKKTFDKESKYLGKKFEEGLVLFGLIVQAESMRHCPVDTGALRNSHRTDKSGSGYRTVVKVSCQTAYAIFVHENLEAFHKPGTWAKFLERALRDKTKEGIRVMKAHMKS